VQQLYPVFSSLLIASFSLVLLVLIVRSHLIQPPRVEFETFLSIVNVQATFYSRLRKKKESKDNKNPTPLLCKNAPNGSRVVVYSMKPENSGK